MVVGLFVIVAGMVCFGWCLWVAFGVMACWRWLFCCFFEAGLVVYACLRFFLMRCCSVVRARWVGVVRGLLWVCGLLLIRGRLAVVVFPGFRSGFFGCISLVGFDCGFGGFGGFWVSWVCGGRFAGRFYVDFLYDLGSGLGGIVFSGFRVSGAWFANFGVLLVWCLCGR